MIDTQNSIAGAASAPARTPGGTLGKEEFLRLLITQLRNQDPLNPLDQNQFLAQTAQFSALEQLTNISKALEAMRSAAVAGSAPQAALLLGKTAQVSGRQFQFDGSPTPLTFNLNLDGRVTIEILDQEGNLLRQIEGGAKPAGAHAVDWDGRDSAGRAILPGSYFYRVVTFDTGSGTPSAVAAEGPLTGFQMLGNRIVYRMGGSNAVVRQEDIVDVR